MMKISIIGSGYVGLVTGICFAELGNEVCFIDKDKNKLRDIEANNPPFFEPGLGNLMEKNCSRVAVADSITEGIKTADCTFICVGTPPCPDGSIDLGFVKQVALELGAVMSARQGHLVIMKSTVTPGTTENVVAPLIEEKSGGKRAEDFYIAVNPEFLREGNAVHDFFHPDRIIFGIHDMKAKNILDMLYSGFSSPKLYTTCKTAEMIKYANNAFLATKISFSNEIGNICKKIGVDAFNVFEGVGLDSRINPLFFKCGLGFGGSCFPKDVRALIRFAEEQGEVVPILHSVLEVNEIQPARMIALLRSISPTSGIKK